jgi:hypothetical protein
MIIFPACICRQDSRSRWNLAEGHSAMADDLEYRNFIMVFELEGEFPIAGNALALKQAWVRLQRRYHEAGCAPDPKRVATINAAYSALKRLAGEGDPRTTGSPESKTYRVWAWDGERLTKGVSERSSPNQFPEVARVAMERMSWGFRRPRAIFLEDDEDEWNLLMIHMSGRDVVPPRKFPRQGSVNLAQDPILLRDLAEMFGSNN